MQSRAVVRRQYRFGVALGLVLLSFLVYCFVPRSTLGNFLILATYCATLTFVLRTSDLKPTTLRLWRPILIVIIVFALATLLGDSDRVRGLGGILAALLLVATVGAVGRGAMRQARSEAMVSVSTVIGVVTIYLLLGLIYATMFGAFSTMHGPGFFNGVEGDPTGVDLTYYSIITMATVGYGDITPLTDIGRLTACTAALIGQLYLVTVVAIVVSNIGRRPRESAL